MIPLVNTDEAIKRAKEAGVEERFANLNAFRGMLHNPNATAAFANLLATLLWRNTLNPRLRELVILRTGWRTGSEYEFCQHVRVSRELKMTEEEILGVRDPDACRAYSEIDRAVLRMADELHTNAEVAPATWATLTRSFAPAELIELLLVAGFWRMVAGYLKTAAIPLDADVPSWPEGKAPQR